MNSGNPDLIRFIRADIEKRGPVSFAWFMHQALYHPEHGYYSSGRCAIGRKGDYFTNVSVGPLFGQLLGGQFARDVFESVQKRSPEFFEALRYRIVEPFPIFQERQSRTLELFRDKIEWRSSLQPFMGVHFSNELLDAMPVRLISNGREKFVGVDGDKFIFVERLVDDDVKFNQPALDWINEVAANLQRGYVIAVDYGRSDAEFQGDVQIRARHRNLDSPFEQIGHADITMHVDWPSIAECAQANGLRVAGFTDQHHFLTGIMSELGRVGSPEPTAPDWGQSTLPDSPKAKRELQTLLHPEMLGRAFQVLALSKNVDSAAPKLAGFKFARKPASVLGVSRDTTPESRARRGHRC